MKPTKTMYDLCKKVEIDPKELFALHSAEIIIELLFRISEKTEDAIPNVSCRT